MMVSVEVTGCAPGIATDGATEQAGAVAPAGPLATAQVSATLPVKPPLGVMVRLDVAEAPGAKGLMALPLNAKVDGGGRGEMVIATVVVWVRVPEVPVTVAE